MTSSSAISLLQAVLNARASLWIDQGKAAPALGKRSPASLHSLAIAAMDPQAIAAEQTAENGVLTERSLLTSLKEKFSDSKVEISGASLKIKDDFATLAFHQTTMLTMENITGSEPPTMADSVSRTATFIKLTGGWRLKTVQHVTGPDSSLLDALPTLTETAEVIKPGTSAPGAIDGLGPASTTGAPKPLTASQFKGVKSVGVASKAVRPATSYNYGAMVSYATSHWNSGDPEFPSFGDDCANFVSRALYHGGWTMDTLWYYRWWRSPTGGAPIAQWGHAFTVSADWFKYANSTSHRTHTTASVWNLALADVLQADFERDGRIDHTMFVTALSSTDRFITEHTSNNLNKSMKLIFAQYPSATWYASVT